MPTTSEWKCIEQVAIIDKENELLIESQIHVCNDKFFSPPPNDTHPAFISISSLMPIRMHDNGAIESTQFMSFSVYSFFLPFLSL